MIKLIVGLANPNKKYTATRHNAGSWYVNLLVARLHTSLYEDPNFFSLTSCGILFGTKVYFLVPTTFMNLSGKAVATFANFYHISPHEILVAHDELDLSPGVAKFKYGGGHGGHNGLKDIISKLANNNFYRLRIGIGRPKNKDTVVDFVLSKPLIFEQKLINTVLVEAVSCTEIWFRDTLAKATNRLHTFKIKN